jgi:hypothetical protein
MTENPPTGIIISPDLGVSPATAPPGIDQDDSDQAGTVDVAKEQAASVGQGAADAGQHVAGVAQDQVKNVVAEAGSQAKDLLGQARSELSEQASAQQQRLATGLHALGDELHSMTQRTEQPGVATDLARQGAGKSHDIASWLEDREPGQLVAELQSFARQRPGTFLLAAAGAGLLAGRLTRGVKDASSDDNDASPTSGSASPSEHRPLPGVPNQLDLVSGSEPTGPGRSGGAGL